MSTRTTDHRNRKRVSRAGGWVLAALLMPATLLAQEAQDRIEAAMERARAAGIPTELLESRVQEGTAKGIPTDRIAGAVQARLDGLARAREALEGVPDVAPSDLDVGADALESGVSAAVLAELAEAAPRERRAVAIAALTYLVDSEVVPEEALARVQEALGRGPEALANLPARAGGAGAAGPPQEIPGGPPADAGPPEGIPAPGDAPAGGRPDGAGGPGGGPPDGLPGPGGGPGF